MTEKFTGETLEIPIVVTGDGITSLDGAKILFRAIHKESGTTINRDPVIDGMTVTARLESLETLLPGVYACEIRGIFSNLTKTLLYEEYLFKHANIREAVTYGS